METLDEWIERQSRHAAAAMLRSISPLGIVKHRPGFGQRIQPRAGAIVASPVLADYDPDPDYFFHWFRDSAVVIEAVRLLSETGAVAAASAARIFADFLDFSLSLCSLQGSALVAAPGWRAAVAPEFEKFVRPDPELAAVRGALVAAEARVNADGSLDISRWARPQHDGPPLRLLAVLRWLRRVPLEPQVRARAVELVGEDLAFTRARWPIASFDIWEEELGHHYYTLRVAAAALCEGAAWLEGPGAAQPLEAHRCRTDAQTILRRLDDYWLAQAGHYRSRVLDSGRSAKELDIAVIFAAIHGEDGTEGAHTVHDPRMQATLERLEALFAAAYQINRDRPAGRGPAMGRYEGDVYYSGGAYYFSTLAAAEFCYKAAAGARGGAERARLLSRAEAFLETVRAYTPPSGDMSEQFDQRTGAQTSARHLAWSYAAFISCVAARRDANGNRASRP